jgi:hypothetical protein
LSSCTRAKAAKSGARSGSKTRKILDLLKRPGGAASRELLKAPGGQTHGLRGSISSTLGEEGPYRHLHQAEGGQRS